MSERKTCHPALHGTWRAADPVRPISRSSAVLGLAHDIRGCHVARRAWRALRFSDPARFSLAHGGKDRTLSCAAEGLRPHPSGAKDRRAEAKLGQSEKLAAIKLGRAGATGATRVRTIGRTLVTGSAPDRTNMAAERICAEPHPANSRTHSHRRTRAWGQRDISNALWQHHRPNAFYQDELGSSC